MEDGRVVDLEPDPSRYPYDPKVLAGCRRWKMNLDVLDGDDRVNYPLRRVGERGANNWERVSWDEALDDIAQRLSQLRDRYGSETLASMIGGPHASFWPLHRFMNMFGSPNNMGIRADLLEPAHLDGCAHVRLDDRGRHQRRHRMRLHLGNEPG